MEGDNSKKKEEAEGEGTSSKKNGAEEVSLDGGIQEAMGRGGELPRQKFGLEALVPWEEFNSFC